MDTRPIAVATPMTQSGWREPDDPRREIAVGVYLIGGVLAALALWAALTPLDSAAYAPGQIAVSGHRQTLQHREGGVVRDVLVKEGDHVQAGQVLIQLVGADVSASRRGLGSQLIGLRAERARLRAEEVSAASIEWPPEFAAMTGEEADEARRAIQVQEERFRTRGVSVTSHKTVLRQRVAELKEQIGGYERLIDATAEQRRLIADELASMKGLADQGYAPMSQVRALERNQAELDGRLSQYRAQIAQFRQQIGEVELQSVQVETDQKEQVAKELRDTEFQINDVQPKLDAAIEQMARTQVRAPSSGAVVGLTMFGVGGVVMPGQRLMDIVPDRSPLVIEVRFKPADIDGVHVGQNGEVKLGGERDRTMPILKGVITELSADSLTNEKTGEGYFMAEVTIPPSQLDLAYKARGGEAALLRPGLPVQVIVPLAKRTALQYLFEPLSRTLWRSFRER